MKRTLNFVRNAHTWRHWNQKSEIIYTRDASMYSRDESWGPSHYAIKHHIRSRGHKIDCVKLVIHKCKHYILFCLAVVPKFACYLGWFIRNHSYRLMAWQIFDDCDNPDQLRQIRSIPIKMRAGYSEISRQLKTWFWMVLNHNHEEQFG